MGRAKLAVLAIVMLLVVSAVAFTAFQNRVNLSGKKIAILIEERYLHVYAEATIAQVQKLGGTVVIVAPRPGTITAMDDPVKTLEVDLVIGDVDVSDFDGLMIPGGFSYERLIPNTEAMSLIREFHRQGKIIAGVCAGTRVMSAAGILEGSRATGNSVTGITSGGAQFVADPVVVTGRLITAQSSGMHDMNKRFAEELSRQR